MSITSTSAAMTQVGQIGTTVGYQIGFDSSQPIGFYGVSSPTTRQTKPTFTVTTGAVSTTTGSITSWGFSTSTQANTLTVAVSDIISVLTTLGLVA
jgi:hypothetical protein